MYLPPASTWIPFCVSKKLSGMPLEREIENYIQLQGSMPKTAPMYQLTPKQEETLRAPLK